MENNRIGDETMSLLDVVRKIDNDTEQIMRGVNTYCDVILGSTNQVCSTHLEPNKCCAKPSENDWSVYDYMKHAYDNISQAKDWFVNLIKQAELDIVPTACKLYEDTFNEANGIVGDDMPKFGRLSSILYTTVMDCVSLFNVVRVSIFNNSPEDIDFSCDTKEPCILDCLNKCSNTVYRLSNSMREYFSDYVDSTVTKEPRLVVPTGFIP